MKRTSVLLCLLTAALLTAVPVLTGCDQVKDAAHNVNVDKPDEVNACIFDFLSENRSPSYLQ